MNIFRRNSLPDNERIRRENKGRLVSEIPASPSKPAGDREFRFSIACIAKDEGPYLEEWIEFHRLVGCEHFVIYDNGSTDNTSEVLRPYISANIVTLVPWPNFCATHNLQMLSYAHALSHMGPRTYWLCFIDVDEFLFPKDGEDLVATLAEFADEPAVAVYWSLFGTSGHREAPEGCVIENYTQRMPYPTEPARLPDRGHLQEKVGIFCKFKSIVQPSRITGTIGAHAFRSDRFPVRAVDESWNEIQPRNAKTFSNSKLQLNHYISKSRAEWENRLRRGDVTGFDRIARKELMLEIIESEPVADTEIMRFLPKLRARLDR